MIRLLADENVPGSSVAALRESGLDVVWMAEVGAGDSDVAVLERARGDQRVLLTLDRDFGELIFRAGHAPPPGVIYLRLVPSTSEEIATLVTMLLDHPDIQLETRFTTVNRDQVRQRPFP